MTDTGPNLGQMAPAIDLLDGNGQRWKLSGVRGKVVALFFYPGDETPVCTKQMCSERDNWARYQQTGAEVVGVSTFEIETSWLDEFDPGTFTAPRAHDAGSW
jgi:peroxiredoxin Q/BCP